MSHELQLCVIRFKCNVMLIITQRKESFSGVASNFTAEHKTHSWDILILLAHNCEENNQSELHDDSNLIAFYLADSSHDIESINSCSAMTLIFALILIPSLELGTV